jgi:hypothetical protein
LTNGAGKFQHSIRDTSILIGKPIVIDAVEQNNQPPQFSLRPNPAHGSELIIEGDWVSQGIRIEIYDLLGEKLRTVEVHNALRRQSIEIGDLVTGSYYLRLQSGGHLQTRKFTVEH